MVKMMTMVKVPIMEAGVLGENWKHVSTEMARKYTLAALVNWKSRESGAQEISVYFVVLIELLFFNC
jgi:hypothetical protein